MRIINIGLVGLGVVGSGTLSVLAQNAREISRRTNCEIRVVAIAVNNLNKARNCDIGEALLTDNFMDVITHPTVDVVVELMGGVDTALSVVLTALDNDKHVVTANKALIALHGEKIFSHAQKQQKIVRFEAAVAGGIPIIKLIREGFSANQIEYLSGIINGTSNFILSQMQSQGCQFDVALKQAQELGYAEADPTFDVEGTDAAHKLTILAALAFGFWPEFEQIYQQGITQISPEDINYAKELGYAVKHIGLARRNDAGIEMRVHPALIPEEKLIAHINGVMNAVLVKGNVVGETLCYGAGAGAEPTASAVVADIVDTVREMTSEVSGRVPYLAFQPNAMMDYPILPIGQVQTAYYIRMKILHQPDVMASITATLGQHDISIKTLMQPNIAEECDDNNAQEQQYKTVILLTENALESSLRNAVKTLQALPVTHSDVVSIRMESFAD